MKIENRIETFLEWVERRPLLILVFILLLNVVLKFLYIGKTSFWIDEAYSTHQSLQSVNEIVQNSSQEQNPPFYYLLLSGWQKLFTISETGMRSLSAVLSALSAVLI